jgi:hypothetical protein
MGTRKTSKGSMSKRIGNLCSESRRRCRGRWLLERKKKEEGRKNALVERAVSVPRGIARLVGEFAVSQINVGQRVSIEVRVCKSW